MNTYTKTAVSSALAAAMILPALALAQGVAVQPVAVGAAAGVTADTPIVRAQLTASTTAEVTRGNRPKDKASQEIDRRIKALNDLLIRVEAMTKVTDALKANLKTNIQNQINGLTALKVKIEADTDIATLKTDVKSITDSYRVFMLVMPQSRIAAASDRMATIINMMASVGTKLQARLTAAKTAGNDTAALEAVLADLGTQLTAAQTNAQAAVNTTAPLVPDNGDKTAMASNDAALAKARADLKAGQADLVVARKDIETIIKGLKTLKVSATASTSAQTQ